MALIPTATGMRAWNTGRNRLMNTTMPPRRSSSADARSQEEPSRRPSRDRRIVGPARRPSRKPSDCPHSEVTTTTTVRTTKCTGSLTAVAAATTIVSPGTMSPTKSVVSSSMPTPAITVPHTGPTASTRCSAHEMTWLSQDPSDSIGPTDTF